MKVQVRIEYTVQKVPEGVKAAFKDAKDWELLEPDGYRAAFADTEKEAMDELSNIICEMLTSMKFVVTKLTDEEDGS